VIDDMRRIGFAVIDANLVQFYAVLFAIIPRAHDMPITGMIHVNYALFMNRVFSAHDPTSRFPSEIAGLRFLVRRTTGRAGSIGMSGISSNTSPLSKVPSES